MKLDREQKKIVRLIRREGRNITDPKLRSVYERAAVQTGLVESGLHNLNYGDADSQGWRQERASLYKNPTNLRASIRRFRQEFEQQYDPGEHSYEVAAQVQRPAEQYRGRYKDVSHQAAQILGRAGGGPELSGQGPQSSFETVPGVNNAGLRQQFLQQYLMDRGKPNALLDLQSGLDSAQDIPAKRVKLSDGSGSVRTTPAKPVRGRGRLGNQVSLVDDLIRQFSAPITAKQEPGHAAGGDHDPAVKGATARDVGGDEATREALFRALTRKLGVKNAVYKGPDINVVKGGVRYQIISRDHGTGPHLHIGLRRNGR